MDTRIDYFIFAGEPSADVHGKELITELKKLHPTCNIATVSGPKMRQEKTLEIDRMERFMAMGFLDVISSIPRLVYLFFNMRKKILKLSPKTLIFIDYPGFNLKLERSLRKKGFKNQIIHYVSPSVWAWSKKRIDVLAQNVDHLLTIFPFEKKCYEKTDLNVTYVGNPIAYKIQNLEIKYEPLFISIFPGSRKAEIERNLPLQLEVASQFKNMAIAISVSSERYEKLIKRIVKNRKVYLAKPSESYSIMQKSKLAIATSGTVNLELAMMGIPTVVTFAVKSIDLFIVRKVLKIDLPFYSIVNIIENEEIFPELFGPNFTKNKLYYYIKRFLESENARNRCLDQLSLLKKNLEEKNPAQKAAQLIFSTRT